MRRTKDLKVILHRIEEILATLFKNTIKSEYSYSGRRVIMDKLMRKRHRNSNIMDLLKF